MFPRGEPYSRYRIEAPPLTLPSALPSNVQSALPDCVRQGTLF